MTDERTLNQSEIAAKLTEYRGKTTHYRLVRRAMNNGAPFSVDPLTRKPCFLWSEFLAWYKEQLVSRTTSPKVEAQKAAARAK